MPTNPKEYYPPMHTAEHILNQTMIRMFNTERSFSNHIERKKSKCDYRFNRNLNDDELINLQNEINKIIGLNLDVTERIINAEDAEGLINFERLPEDFGEQIRLIQIGRYDTCPCSGVRVHNTSEIGNIRIISTSYDDEVLRVRFKLQAKI